MRISRIMKRTFMRHSVDLGRRSIVDVREHLTKAERHRFDRRTDAERNEDHNGKRSADAGYCLCVKCVENIWKHQHRELNAATNML